MKKAIFAALAAGAVLSGCNAEPAQPEQTVQQLMATKVQPTAEVFWNSVQYISDEQGEHDIFPKTDADWKRTRDAATAMGKLGELLKTPGYAEGRGEDWIQIASSLVEVSKLAEQAADARDPDKVFQVGGTLYNVCSACHQVFPPAAGADAEAPPTGPEASPS